MKKLIIKISTALTATIRTGSIFQEEDLTLFVIKAIFLLVFIAVLLAVIVIIHRVITSPRTINFLKETKLFRKG